MTKGNENSEAGQQVVGTFEEFGEVLDRIEPGDSDALQVVIQDLSEYSESLGELSIAVDRFLKQAVHNLELAYVGDSDWEAAVTTACRLLDAASGGTMAAADASGSSQEEQPAAEASSVDVEPSEPVALEEEDYSVPEFTEDDQELVSEFVNESTEYLDEAESALLTLEEHPEDLDTIDTIFRCFHTIKGVAAFLGFEAVAALSHRAESLLSRARGQEIMLTGGYATLALQSVDTLKEFVECIRQGQMDVLPKMFRGLMQILTNPDAHVSADAPLKAKKVEDSAGKEECAEDAAEPKVEGLEKLASDSEIKSEKEAVAKPEEGAAKPEADLKKKTSKTGPSSAKTGSKVEATVRVRTDRLDRLIDAVGELVIAQSMVAEDPGARGIDLQKKVTHAGKIVRDLQDMTLALRMVPLKATMQKMSRVVRDVARKQGKRVELISSGAETEIDRAMVDVISDPLVHMVRNSVDHGIESEEERVALGKSPIGQIHLSAHHAQGSVVVSLVDDGKGLDRKKIAEKAISQGLIESDEGMSDSDVFRLIFSAGFSTAEKVTDVSGRGVGMDVVRRAIESLKGSIDIYSELGKGTTFEIRLPLTLAITDGMLVKVGKQRYIIPIVNIVRSLRPTKEELFSVTGRGELVVLRGEQVPIYRLHEIYNVSEAEEDPTNALLVIVTDGERMSALLVDSLLGKQQAVTKSLGAGIGNVPGVSGGAILGDGRVGLILDPNSLVGYAREAGMRPRITPRQSKKVQSQPSAQELS